CLGVISVVGRWSWVARRGAHATTATAIVIVIPSEPVIPSEARDLHLLIVRRVRIPRFARDDTGARDDNEVFKSDLVRDAPLTDRGAGECMIVHGGADASPRRSAARDTRTALYHRR